VSFKVTATKEDPNSQENHSLIVRVVGAPGLAFVWSRHGESRFEDGNV
jgi:hypothetical protein